MGRKKLKPEQKSTHKIEFFCKPNFAKSVEDAMKLANIPPADFHRAIYVMGLGKLWEIVEDLKHLPEAEQQKQIELHTKLHKLYAEKLFEGL